MGRSVRLLSAEWLEKPAFHAALCTGVPRVAAKCERGDSNPQGLCPLDPKSGDRVLQVPFRKELAAQPTSGGALYGALGHGDSGKTPAKSVPELSEHDLGIQALLDAWPNLPHPIKAGILAMIREVDPANRDDSGRGAGE